MWNNLSENEKCPQFWGSAVYLCLKMCGLLDFESYVLDKIIGFSDNMGQIFRAKNSPNCLWFASSFSNFVLIDSSHCEKMESFCTPFVRIPSKLLIL